MPSDEDLSVQLTELAALRDRILADAGSEVLLGEFFAGFERYPDAFFPVGLLEPFRKLTGWERACVESVRRRPAKGTVRAIAVLLFDGVHTVHGVLLQDVLSEVVARRDDYKDVRLLARDYLLAAKQRPKGYYNREVP